MKTPLLRSLALSCAAAVALGAAACGTSGAGDDGKVDVVASFYPLQFIAERVGGDAASVTNLAKPGAEPHDLELSPRQVAQIADARLVVYLKGFQPTVDEAVAQEAAKAAFDVATVEPLRAVEDAGPTKDTVPTEPGADRQESAELNGKDPHVWLDPVRLAAIGDRLAEQYAAADPAHAPDYRARGAALHAELSGLDKEYADALRTCDRREIFVSHDAFGYLADRYHLRQVGISGLAPEQEPTAAKLTEVAALARTSGATTIFFETLVSPKLAQTLAKEVGARAEVLDPIEGLTEGAGSDYTAVMRANLGRLVAALGCHS